jgi:hypothetical protein
LTDVDGLHGTFLAIDENGQRLFAITSKDGTAQNAGLTIAKLANVPLGIGTLTPPNGPATGGTQITIHGSGFQNGATVTITDMNTLTLVTPALPRGPSASPSRIRMEKPSRWMLLSSLIKVETLPTDPPHLFP